MLGHSIWVFVMLAAGGLWAQNAADPDKEARLKRLVELLQSFSDEDYQGALQKAPPAEANRPALASRGTVIKKGYRTLALLEYRKAAKKAPNKEGYTRAYDRASADASSMAAINPETMQETGWALDLLKWLGNAAINYELEGGRTYVGRQVKSPELRKLDSSISSYENQLASAELDDEKEADVRYQLAQAYEARAEAALPKSAAKPEKAAATPAAAVELTPRQIYHKNGPAVVLLMCTGSDGTGELGSGSLIDANGHVLTNAHVVLRGSTGQPYENINVFFKPAKLTGDPKQDLKNPRKGKVVKSDRPLDLALVELEEAPSAAAVMPIGDADAVSAGDPVVAIGHPEQGGLWTLTQGVVSTVVADLGGVPGKHVFQTDASINRGNSGGPLIDRQGSLIGVNSSMARKATDGLAITSVNFSLKSSVVKTWLGASVALREPEPPAAETVAQAEPAPARKVDAVAEDEAKPEAPVRPAAKPAPKPWAAPKDRIVTPKKPFVIDQLMKDMAEMEDMEKEMHGEFERLRGRLGK